MASPRVKQMLMAAAGAGGDPLNVEDVFSTYLYRGNGSQNLAVVNGIDLAGEGGMVWYRKRNGAENNSIEDTVRGLDNVIYTDSANAQADPGAYGLQAFNSDGFTAGFDTSGGKYASWTFRKAPKFFDIVTYTGNGTAGRTISHNLGTTVGSVWIKKTNSSAFWMVYHRGMHSSTPQNYHLALNYNFSINDLGVSQQWNQTAPTSTQFTLGQDSNVNGNGDTYVAYFFAHNNNGDGGFGINADQDIIKCGSYTGNGSSSGQDVNLGFEPEFVLYKCVTQTQDWRMVDGKRGVPYAGSISSEFNHQYLRPNLSSQENDDDDIEFYANGFRPKTSGQQVNGGSETYIYIAIRRGPMAIPESSSSCFHIETRGATLPNPPAFDTSFDVDFAWRGVPGGAFVTSRSISGVAGQATGYMELSSSGFRTTSGTYALDWSKGWFDNSGVTTSDYGYMWGRAPGFFDMTAYKGNNTARTVPHNLGVVPEMIWIKKYNASGDWFVYHSGLSSNSHMIVVNSEDAQQNEGTKFWNSTTPTSSVFSIGNHSHPNANNDLYLALLWATLPGVSKVGSFTGNGSSQNIDCGFSNGSKLVIIKSSSASGPWHLWDTARGIVAGNDTSFQLNNNSGLTGDAIDPLSSGFTVNSTGNITNDGGRDYIFYAIAA